MKQGYELALPMTVALPIRQMLLQASHEHNFERMAKFMTGEMLRAGPSLDVPDIKWFGYYS